MSSLLGRLPDVKAKLVLMSGEYPELTESLQQLGIDTVTTIADKRLPKPIQWHPDMQMCIIEGRIIALKDGALVDILRRHAILAGETKSTPESIYPNDVLCNVLTWKGWALGNSKTTDESILQAAKSLGFTWVNVNQGYAACTTVLVNERSAITADNGIADQMEHYGMKVLRISPGAIRLPGYPYGFIGGCCGKLAPNIIAFTGSLDSHPDGYQITRFLSARDICPIELSDGELLDVGGMIALR